MLIQSLITSSQELATKKGKLTMKRKIQYARRLVDLSTLRQMETNPESIKYLDEQILLLSKKIAGVK